MDGKGLRARLSAVRGGGLRAGLAGALLLVACAIVAGCETAPPRQPESAPLSFAHLPPIVFDLGRIEVVERPVAPDPADVGHLFLTAPATAVRLWVEERLRTSGTDGLLRVTIEEASARTTALATNAEFRDLFKEEQAERLDLHLRVTIAAVDEKGDVRGYATADAQTLPHPAGGHHAGRARAALRRDLPRPARRLQRQSGTGDPAIPAPLPALRR